MRAVAARLQGRHGASSSAHHWARKLGVMGLMGLDARIMAAQLVAPYRMQGCSGKNDANDAAAICDGCQPPEHAVRAHQAH